MLFEGFFAAYGAAVAPGRAVVNCQIQPGSPATAVLQLRCPLEASNCQAFAGLQWNGCSVQVRIVLVERVCSTTCHMT